ncbi:hypothetical protein LNK20_20950, partial [Bacillus safensis]|nr:hypothetical protein [Bacillus safensis]
GGKLHEVGRQRDNFWLLLLEDKHLEVFALDSNGITTECDVSDQTAAVVMRLLTPTTDGASFLVDQNGWIRFRWSGREKPEPSVLKA